MSQILGSLKEIVKIIIFSGALLQGNLFFHPRILLVVTSRASNYFSVIPQDIMLDRFLIRTYHQVQLYLHKPIAMLYSISWDNSKLLKKNQLHFL